MRRISPWPILLVLALLIAPVASAPAMADEVEITTPASVQAPAATTDEEIILIESSGRLRIDDPYTPAGIRKVVWNSPETGWVQVAAGDFNGDGDAEIVAIQGGRIKVYDPVVQPGRAPVALDRTLEGGRVFRLLAIGDFDGDGKDEIATTHTDTGTGIVESLRVYDGGANATDTEWTVIRSEPFGAYWQNIAAGDVNADGADDLIMTRNPDLALKLVKVVNGRNWGTIAEGQYNFTWLTLAAGNLSSAYPGDELALTRADVLGERDSLILFRVSGTGFADVVPNAGYRYYPYFTSLALGDVNGDGDDEVLLLRDPQQPNVALLMVNPAGDAIRTFQHAIGYGATAWNQVRSGDIDGDGRDEIVVLRGDRYRMYLDPQSHDGYEDVTGSFRTSPASGTGTPPAGGDTPVIAIANVDGPGESLGPTLAVSPTSLTFDLEYRQTSPVRNVSITNTGTSAAIAWQAQVISGSEWLVLSSTSGTTPATLGVSINTAAVSPGTYTGRIRITATTAGVAGSPQEIAVALTIRGVRLVVNPLQLSYQVAYGQFQSKTVTISSAGGSAAIQWQADILEGSAWLALNATSGTAPSTLIVTVNATAAGIGSRTGTIRVRALDPQIADSPQFISIALTVPDPGFVVDPDQMILWQRIGAEPNQGRISVWRGGPPADWVATALPMDVAVEVAARLAAGEGEVSAQGISLDGAAVNPPAWLSFTPDQGRTGAAPTIMTVSAQGTTPGTYRAMIIVVATDPTVPNRVQTVEVTAYLVNQLYRTLIPLGMK